MHRVHLYIAQTVGVCVCACMLFLDKSKSFPFAHFAPPTAGITLTFCCVLLKCFGTCFVSTIKFQLQPHGCLVGKTLNDNRKSIVLISWHAVACLHQLQHLDYLLPQFAMQTYFTYMSGTPGAGFRTYPTV